MFRNPTQKWSCKICNHHGNCLECMQAQCKKIAFYKNLEYNNNKTLATDVCEEKDSGFEEKEVASSHYACNIGQYSYFDCSE